MAVYNNNNNETGEEQNKMDNKWKIWKLKYKTVYTPKIMNTREQKMMKKLHTLIKNPTNKRETNKKESKTPDDKFANRFEI